MEQQNKPKKKSVYSKEGYEQNMDEIKKKSVHSKEGYEQNKDEIKKYRRERYRYVPNVFLVCS